MRSTSATPARKGLAALALGLAALGPCLAAAEAPAVGLAVLPARGDDLVAMGPLARRLQRAFAGDAAAALVDMLGLVRQISRPPRPDTLQELQQGLEQLAGGRHGQARRTLAGVLGRMRGALAAVRLEELAFVQLHLAAAELGAGRRRAARRTLAELLVWRRGDLPVLSGQAPPGWEALVADAAAPPGAVGALEVLSSPEGALASLDGRLLGATPVLATNLAPGDHYLEVALPGHSPTVVAVPVTARRRSVSVQLRRHPEASATVRRLLGLRPGLGRPRLPGIGELGHQLGLERLLLITALPTGDGIRLRGFLYDARDEGLLASAEVRGPAAPDRSQLQPLRLWRRGAAPSPMARGDDFSPRPPPGAPRPWYRRWYVWTAVGAALVAAVVLPVTLTSRDDAPPGERFVIRW